MVLHTLAAVDLAPGSVLLWLIVGGLAGWITGRIMGGGFGFIGDIVVGLVGAFLGSILIGLFVSGTVGFFGTLLVAATTMRTLVDDMPSLVVHCCMRLGLQSLASA